MSSEVAPRAVERFHFRMAIVFVIIAFGGFIPTYWAPLTSGQLHAPPALHIHGALQFVWTLFYLAQTGWVALGRMPRHRAWGMAGISLFTLLCCSIILLKITMMRIDDARGYGEASRAFSAVALLALPVMIGLFAVAIANVRRPEVHKRLMFSLMAAFMVPAIARVFLTFFAPPGAMAGGPPPPFVSLPPTIVALLLFAMAIVYDWRRERRVHAAYVWPAAVVLLSNLFTLAVADTPTWHAIARYVQGLAG
jgi:hypothetical protein